MLRSSFPETKMKAPVLLLELTLSEISLTSQKMSLQTLSLSTLSQRLPFKNGIQW